MKAIAKKRRGKGLNLIEAPLPKVEAQDVLVRVKKSSICGTDLHIYNWDDWAQKTMRPPMIIGHEFMGEVVEVGKGVRGIAIGDMITCECHITCRICRNCQAGRRHLCRNTLGIGIHRQGGFAEYISIPEENVFKLPPNDLIDSSVASIFDPYGNAVHTALSFDLTGEDILITGAGPTGLMACAVARHVGARHIVITDHNEYRLELAKNMGATSVLAIHKSSSLDGICKDLGIVEGFDVGFEMSGSPKALSQMLKVMNHGGKIAALGIFSKEATIDWNQIIFKSLKIKGIYGREIFETWYKMVNFLKSGLDISSVITHSYTADDFEKGFALMESGRCGKVILDWSSGKMT